MTTLGPDGNEYPTIVIEGFRALFNRDYERFEELLENGLDINSRGPYYNSFIIIPVSNYNIISGQSVWYYTMSEKQKYSISISIIRAEYLLSFKFLPIALSILFTFFNSSRGDSFVLISITLL